MTKLKIDRFLDFSALSNLETNPSQTQLSFVKANMRLDKNDYIHALYLHDGSRSRRVLTLKKADKYFWESDTTILYFDEKNKVERELKKHKNTVVYRYNIETKENTHAYTFPFPVSQIDFIEDALLLQTRLNNDEHAYFLDEKTRSEFIKQDTANANYEEITSVPFYSDGGTYTRARSGQAFIYKNDTYYPLGSKDESLSNITIEGSKIYYNYTINDGTPTFFSFLREFDLNLLTHNNITPTDEYSYAKLFVINNHLYFLGGDKSQYGMNQNPDIYKVEKSTITKVCDFGLSANNSTGSDVRFGTLTSTRTKDNKFYFTGVHHHHSVIYQFDGETLEQFKISENSIDTFEFFNNKLYSIRITDDSPQELYKGDKQVTRYNAKQLKDTYVAEPIHHQFENDGVTLDGWVLLPENYVKGQSYPSILNIHGGPKTIYSSVFYNEMQVWANEGYVVYFTNPRGGDCYGDEFADIRGKYGTIDYEDIMAFTDLVEKEYELDPKRMGVTGGSYGGFMTNWIVAHTDRFSAAATQRSISNWTSFGGTSDIGAYFAKDQTAADPIDDLDKAWEQSPLKYADNIKTPLLFIHSDEDYRCPIEQAMQLFTRVKMNGVDTKFVWFKNENHGLSRGGRPQSRVKRLTEITEWMNNHLK